MSSSMAWYSGEALWFLIPMRGNERHYEYEFQSTTREFLIPMRGNELLSPTTPEIHLRGF